MSLAAIEGYKVNPETELFYFNESLKTSPEVSDFIEISKAIAVIKTKEGFHEQALRDLEKVLPILKHANAFAYYDFLNSYAVELGEVGRKDEARNIIKHVISSPFINAYPEWQETAQELREPDHSFITVPLIKPEPVKVKLQASREVKPTRPARVIAFPQLKEAPEPKRPQPVKSNQVAGMAMIDKKEFLMTAIRTEMIPETELNRMIYMLGLVDCSPAEEVLNLEDCRTLEDMMIEWLDAIDPEQLVGVLSALQDCEDDERRNNILDDMISFAFEHSRTRHVTEAEWRLKYERRLPEK